LICVRSSVRKRAVLVSGGSGRLHSLASGRTGILSELVGLRVYLDANILIYALEGFALFSTELQLLFDAIQEGRIHGVTSELSLAEVLVKPMLEDNFELRVAYERLLKG
jgi:hypothetical protein